jgi:5,6-dimethylbenzimidazole synthase|uniref:5,6-dimethylbenzimidazole synthase n=1 Tax=Acidicaldus sp. TaxID=1872105 RepID=A0A8J4HAR7_9PROT
MNFSPAFRAELENLFRWRRDVRRFRPDKLAPGTLERLLGLASLAPSVGLSEPWRFVIVEDARRRARVRALFDICNAQALAGYEGERAARYAGLKLAGLDAAPAQFAAFADRTTAQGAGLGRQTMPEMAEYSVVAAIHTLWLAARAEGIGLGWVSILAPAEITAILEVPPEWRFIGYFCLGWPEDEADTPELQRAGWEERGDATSRLLRR